jgi:excisionase family DNA binding protein
MEYDKMNHPHNTNDALAVIDSAVQQFTHAEELMRSVLKRVDGGYVIVDNEVFAAALKIQLKSVQTLHKTKTIERLPAQRERLADPIPETAQNLGIGERLLWKLISEGKIQSIKIGRRRLVTRNAQRKYLERILTEFPEKRPPEALTKLTKGASVSSVSTQGGRFPEDTAD